MTMLKCWKLIILRLRTVLVSSMSMCVLVMVMAAAMEDTASSPVSHVNSTACTLTQ